jgi:hypothetical protein
VFSFPLSLAGTLVPHVRTIFLPTPSGRCFPKSPPTESAPQSPPSLLRTTPGLYKPGAAPLRIHLIFL